MGIKLHRAWVALRMHQHYRNLKFGKGAEAVWIMLQSRTSLIMAAPAFTASRITKGFRVSMEITWPASPGALLPG